jgi:hypothetical protein
MLRGIWLDGMDCGALWAPLVIAGSRRLGWETRRGSERRTSRWTTSHDEQLRPRS